ncbi:hypothetical protein [Streptomyces sp. NPDC005955]|uniref:hypothetical protein n=1 Tax=Streptomyces sp. NPDC005955 TaxID=3364738 RepID=UPI0036B6DF00
MASGEGPGDHTPGHGDGGGGAHAGGGGRSDAHTRPHGADAPHGDGDGAQLDALRARVAALEAGRGEDRHHRVRSFFAALLITVGCVLAPLSVLSSWAADEVGNTDRYVATVAPLASDPDVQEAVADRVTTALMDHLDLTALLSEAAPADRPRLEKALGRLGGALEGAVQSFVHDKALAVARSDAFAQVWTEANRRAHDSVDKALTGSGGGAVHLTDDAVTVDLGPVVDRVKQRLVADGLTVAGKIPEVHTELTVARSEDIGKVRVWFRVLQVAGDWLPVIAAVLVAGGVLLARRRRRALVAGALGVAFAVAVLGVGLTVFRALYLDALPAHVSQGAAGSVYDALVRFLRSSVRVVAALGVVVAFAAWVTGGGRRARFVREVWADGIGAARGLADRAGFRSGPVGPWVRRYRVALGWGLVGAAALALVLWSWPTTGVLVGLGLGLLFALAVVGFLAGP